MNMNGLAGLVNLGNTCFLNSCVQVLNHTYELEEQFPKYSKHFKNVPEYNIFREWLLLREEMKGQSHISPHSFVRNVQHVAHIKSRDLFTGWAQNDMPEFLLFMIECMHNSISREVNMHINGRIVNEKDEMAIKCYHMLKEVYTKEYSEIMDLFYGIYVSEIYTLNGNNKISHSMKPEPYFMLDLPLPLSFYDHSNRGQVIQLEECFDLFTKSEDLCGENAWFNEKTGSYQNVNKHIMFWNFPKILVITLKRFSPDGRYKLDNLVQFPVDHLDLRKYVTGYNSNSYIYELYGVCNHFGHTNGGHYTSFVKMKNNRWVHFNDSHVQLLDENASPVTQMAYCLFYRKKNN
jgi:ubiquitin carboxyl-terminal hydrolase 8